MSSPQKTFATYHKSAVPKPVKEETEADPASLVFTWKICQNHRYKNEK